MAPSSRARLVVRELKRSDIKAVQELQRRSFATIDPWTTEQLESQLAIFPAGQIGVEIDGMLVATSSALIVDEEDFGAYHTFDEVSDKGYIRNHDPEGDTLYGIDIAIDPRHRGVHLTRRIGGRRETPPRVIQAETPARPHRFPRSASGLDRSCRVSGARGGGAVAATVPNPGQRAPCIVGGRAVRLHHAAIRRNSLVTSCPLRPRPVA